MGEEAAGRRQSAEILLKKEIPPISGTEPFMVRCATRKGMKISQRRSPGGSPVCWTDDGKQNTAGPAALRRFSLYYYVRISFFFRKIFMQRSPQVA